MSMMSSNHMSMNRQDLYMNHKDTYDMPGGEKAAGTKKTKAGSNGRFALFLLTLFMLAGAAGEAWGTTYRFRVVNNQGNIAVEKEVEDPASALTVPDDIKTALNVTDWYFYNTLEEAQADASSVRTSGTPGTVSAASGNITDLSGITNTDNYIYVRYRYTASANDIIDLSGETYYQIKNKSGKYVYGAYNASNSLANTSPYVTTSLSLSDNFMWRFLSPTGVPDPYDINIRLKILSIRTGNCIYEDVDLRHNRNTSSTQWYSNVNFTENGTNVPSVLLFPSTNSGLGYYNIGWIFNDAAFDQYYMYFWGGNGNDPFHFRQKNTPGTSAAYRSNRNDCDLQFERATMFHVMDDENNIIISLLKMHERL